MRRLAALIAIGALGLSVAACGGDDDNDLAQSDLDRAEWIEQADAVCTAANERLDEQADEFFEDEEAVGDDGLERFTREVIVPGLQQQHDDIQALGAPEGDEEEIRDLLDAIQRGIDELREDPDQAFEADTPLTEAGNRAREYGLQVCGREDADPEGDEIELEDGDLEFDEGDLEFEEDEGDDEDEDEAP